MKTKLIVVASGPPQAVENWVGTNYPAPSEKLFQEINRLQTLNKPCLPEEQAAAVHHSYRRLRCHESCQLMILTEAEVTDIVIVASSLQEEISIYKSLLEG